MSEIFEYALIRVVPRIDRGESINAGVILSVAGAFMRVSSADR